MRRGLVAVAALVVVFSAAAVMVPTAQANLVRATTDFVSVELDKGDVAARPGDRISFTSTVTNQTDQPLTGLIAHINILSSDPDVYVDPEDWSSRRTQFLDDLPAGASVDVGWQVQAVTSGPQLLYVTVSQPGTDNVAVSGPLDFMIAGRKTVNPGGVLPVVWAIPAGLLGLLGVSVAWRRRVR